MNIPKTGLRRDTIDKFYTKVDVANELVEIVMQYIHLNPSKDFIIEPSAGNGSFINAIKSTRCQCLFLDIKPEHPEVIQQDFITFQPSDQMKANRIHIIGNPPFGRQAKLALQFIKHSASFATTISFILPKSFKKQSIQDKIPPFFHLLAEKDINSQSFTVDCMDYNVPCVFQIWEYKPTPRLKAEKIVPEGYIFVKHTEPHNIAVRRVGVNAGRVIVLNTNLLSPQSHYYIRFNKNISSDIIELLGKVEYKTKNCVSGPCSISKQDIIREYNTILSVL